MLPTIGSKELVAWLPTLLGLGPGDVVVHPEVAYPTYDVGARLAGATPRAGRRLTRARAPGPATLRLVWLNSPAQPHRPGAAASSTWPRWSPGPGSTAPSWPATSATPSWAGEAGERPAPVPSVLDPRGLRRHPRGPARRLLAVQAVNLAGYRAAFVAGDPALVARLLEVRKHAGMIVPWPVQEAMRAALGDDDARRASSGAVPRRRRAGRCGPRWTAAGFRVDHSEAGLYLWATRGRAVLGTVGWLADRGILVAPGELLRPAGARHVRVALTATDERIATLADRLR